MGLLAVISNCLDCAATLIITHFATVTTFGRKINWKLQNGYTHITEYKKLPVQNKSESSYAVEFPLLYREGEKMEPYYPALTKGSQEQYGNIIMHPENERNSNVLKDFLRMDAGIVPIGGFGEWDYLWSDQAFLS